MGGECGSTHSPLVYMQYVGFIELVVTVGDEQSLRLNGLDVKMLLRVCYF